MESGRLSLLRSFSCSLSLVALALVAALVLTFDFGAPGTVRAENAEALQPSLQEAMVGPILQTIEEIEQRLRGFEANVEAFADSFTSRRITAQTLCVSDESGAQTCLTKQQLDFMIARFAHAEATQPPVTVTDSSAPPAEPVNVATINPEVAMEPTSEVVDQETEHTPTSQSAVSGAAVVWYPEVEISVVEPDTLSDE